MSLVLGIIGERSAGKDTVAAYLAQKYGAFTISHSKILDEILDILDLPISRRNEIDTGQALRGPFGTGIIGQAVRKKVLTASNEVKVIQSIRFPEEVENVKSLGGHIVFIEAPLELRYERASQRQQKTDDNQTFEQFQKMQSEHTEIGIEALKSSAEFTITNDNTLEHLYSQVDQIMQQLQH